jgi:hypothetical protein
VVMSGVDNNTIEVEDYSLYHIVVAVGYSLVATNNE